MFAFFLVSTRSKLFCNALIELSSLEHFIKRTLYYLQYNIDQYNHQRTGQVEEEPYLHRLDVGRAGEAGRHGEVDGGQDHHAGDVNGQH